MLNNPQETSTSTSKNGGNKGARAFNQRVEIIQHTWWEIEPHWEVLHPVSWRHRGESSSLEAVPVQRDRRDGEKSSGSVGVLIIRFSFCKINPLQFVVFANFHIVDISNVIDFKMPTMKKPTGKVNEDFNVSAASMRWFQHTASVSSSPSTKVYLP